MLEYMLTLSLLRGLQFPNILEGVRGALSNPIVLIVLIGLGVLLTRARVR